MGRRIALPRTLGALGLIVGAVALLVGLAFVLIKLAPAWLTDAQGLSPTERDEARGRTRTALFALLAGVIAPVGAIYTGPTFALNRRGQITERFTRAIDQLGDDKMEIRLGGIYALERIAHESSDEHGPIVEVLTAYVRENSPWPPRRRATSRGGPDNEEAEITEQEDATPPEAAVDIKAILTVLARRNLNHEQDPITVDLSRTNLSKVNVFAITLPDVILYAAQLHEANLGNATLQKAFLSHAQLRGALLVGAQLQHATLRGALLQEARLEAAKLRGADLRWAELRMAHLRGADLRDAELQGAGLRDAELRETDLRGASPIARRPGPRASRGETPG
jgi:uncharacterized protein YjbI with pentapeptide repeats